MSVEIKKDDKERALDAKIAAIRAKNQAQEQRQQEVLKDRKLAEKQNQSITTAPRLKGPDDELYNDVQFIQERVGNGKQNNGRRNRDDSFNDSGNNKKDGGKITGGGRLGENEGPPPDPGYRFLADRFRDGSDEETEDGVGGGRGRGKREESWSRGGRGSGRSRGGSDFRGGSELRGSSEFRGGSDFRGGRGRGSDFRAGSRGPTQERQLEQRWEHDKRSDNEGWSDHEFSHGGSRGVHSVNRMRGSRGGNSRGANGNSGRGGIRDDHIQPFIKDMRKASDQSGSVIQEQWGNDSKNIERSHFSNAPKSDKNISPRHRPRQPFSGGQGGGHSSGSYTSTNDWSQSDDDWGQQPTPPTAMVPPRQIEEADGRSIVSKMNNGENKRNNDYHSSPKQNIKPRYNENNINQLQTHFIKEAKPPPLMQQQPDLSSFQPASYNKPFTHTQPEQEFPTSSWKCPDPGCRQINGPKSVKCNKCGFAYKDASDYISNFACDRVKQEYSNNNKKNLYSRQHSDTGLSSSYPSTNGFLQGDNPSVPQPLLPQTGQHHHLKDWSADVDQNNWGGMTSVESGWGAPVTQDHLMMTHQLVSQVMDPTHLQYNMMMQSGVQVPSYPPPFFNDVRHLTPGLGVQLPPFYSQGGPQGSSHDWGSQDQYQHGGYTPQQQTSDLTVFNPSAQVFIPPVPENLYQPPPPIPKPSNIQINTSVPPLKPVSIQNNPTKKNHCDSNLVLTLNKAPTPLALRRPTQDQRPLNKISPDKVDNRISVEKDQQPPQIKTQLSNEGPNYATSSGKVLPIRFQKPKELGNHQPKPPSMIEMQSGSLKKGSLPPPPPGKGKGLLIFGTSNVVSNLEEISFSTELKNPVKLIPTTTLEIFKEKSILLNPSRDWLVLIHGLGDDARSIALKRKSDAEKASEADDIANEFCDIIESRILGSANHICVFVSMLLPRCDFQEKPGMANPNNVRKVINVQITQRLYENPRVTLINSDKVLEWGEDVDRLNQLFQADGYHLTSYGFGLMKDTWLEHIQRKMKESNFIPDVLYKTNKLPANSVQRIDKVPAIARTNQQLSPTQPKENDNQFVEVEEKDRVSVDEEVDILIKEPVLTDDVTKEDTPLDDEDTVPDPFGSYEAPCEIVKTRTISTSGMVDEDDVDDDALPNLETVVATSNVNGIVTVNDRVINKLAATTLEESHENIKLIQTEEPTNVTEEEDEFHDVDDGGFIDDSYCGEHFKDSVLNNPLPSMVSLNPSSDGVTSGDFMEDSYLPPSNGSSGLGSRKTVEFSYETSSGSGIVKIAGDFNSWHPQDMEKRGNSWKFLIDLPLGSYQYKYVVEGEWILDPNIGTSEKDGNKNNIIVVDEEID